MKICLYGSGSRKIDKIYTDAAYELGCIIAKHKYFSLCLPECNSVCCK